MPRTCTVCRHPDRNEIDHSVVKGRSYRDIAAQYSLSKASIQRHAKSHLPGHLVRSEAADGLKRAENLNNCIKQLVANSNQIFELAVKENDLKSALMAVREQSRLLEFKARLLGKIDSNEGGPAPVNRIKNINVKAILLDPKSRAAAELLASKIST